MIILTYVGFHSKTPGGSEFYYVYDRITPKRVQRFYLDEPLSNYLVTGSSLKVKYSNKSFIPPYQIIPGTRRMMPLPRRINEKLFCVKSGNAYQISDPLTGKSFYVDNVKCLQYWDVHYEWQLPIIEVPTGAVIHRLTKIEIRNLKSI